MKKNSIIIIIAILVIAVIVIALLSSEVLNKNSSNEPIRNEGYVDETAKATGGKLDVNINDLFKSDVPTPSGDLKVYFFDVGQGDSIFVQNNDATMLIDAGNNPDGKYISKFLRKELGIKKIDYLIGTHPHEDHIGGIDIILQDFEIGTFFMPNRKVDNKSYTDVEKYATEKNVESISPSVGTKFKVGTALCEIMTQNDKAEEINDTSIVVQLTFGSKKFLFTADLLGTGEALRKWNDIDVLKVSHHGSTYSSQESFLEQVKPEIAVITCEKDNDYYYPHEAVLERLKDVKCNDVYITSTDGTILIESDGNSLRVTKDALPNVDFDGNK
ncbi:MAG: MBL fold metallo-hydrolase [Clostridia bacterium]|nr:MBL fold metallo-hydrolase [Clostridia bacterium]